MLKTTTTTHREFEATGSATTAYNLFESFNIAFVTFRAVVGDTTGTRDGVIQYANRQFADAVGRRQSLLTGMRLIRDLGELPFTPLISSCLIAGELNDTVKTSIEIAANGQNLIFDANCRAVGDLYSAALVNVSDFVLANRSQERRVGELLFVNDALESQAAELAQLAEEIEASRQSLDVEIERRTKLEAELRRLAHFDELTNIANRRSFLADAQNLLTNRIEQSDAIILLDIDHFKTINDTFGHLAGDEMLRRVAAVIAQEIDDLDTLFGRIGGEEFALMVPGADLIEAQGFAEWIRSRICETTFVIDGTELDVTVSLGVAEKQPGQTNLTSLIARADKALYAAKAAGRNNVQLAQL